MTPEFAGLALRLIVTIVEQHYMNRNYSQVAVNIVVMSALKLGGTER